MLYAGRYVAEHRVIISDEAIDTNSLHIALHVVEILFTKLICATQLLFRGSGRPCQQVSWPPKIKIWGQKFYKMHINNIIRVVVS